MRIGKRQITCYKGERERDVINSTHDRVSTYQLIIIHLRNVNKPDNIRVIVHTK